MYSALLSFNTFLGSLPEHRGFSYEERLVCSGKLDFRGTKSSPPQGTVMISGQRSPAS